MNKIKGNPERLARLRELTRAFEVAREAVSEFRRAWAEAEAPAKVGDVVTATGYAFRGKPFEVLRVGLIDLHTDREGRKRFAWRAVGRVLKKDGTPGQNEAEATWEIEE